MTPMPDPDQTKAMHDALSIFAKIAGLFAAFVGGIVTATWAVASKVRGYDDRIKALENANTGAMEKIDKKLDRIHVRIDEIMLNGCAGDFRKLERDGDE